MLSQVDSVDMESLFWGFFLSVSLSLFLIDKWSHVDDGMGLNMHIVLTHMEPDWCYPKFHFYLIQSELINAWNSRLNIDLDSHAFINLTTYTTLIGVDFQQIPIHRMVYVTKRSDRAS